jgi:cobyrinic acid a,c-diamide synthase
VRASGPGLAAPPGCVVAGTGSASGKTTLTLALLCALRARGLNVHAAKTGPDFIDVAFHAALTGRPAANLDTWMCREARPASRPGAGRGLPPGLVRLYARLAAPDADGRPPDLIVAEGAMALFDGGHKGAGSTAQLAARLGLPVLLCLHAGGLGQSAAAVAEGFLRHRPAWAAREAPLSFLGLVCTHVGSPRHAALLRAALAPLRRELPLLGLLPREGAPDLRSRHLGLVEAREALPQVDPAALACWLEQNCRLDLLLRRLGLAPRRAAQKAPGKGPAPAAPHTAARQAAPVTRFFAAAGQLPPDLPAPAGAAAVQAAATRPRPRAARRPVVGLAWDAAFSFCYADLPALWQELGARVVVFSPLQDKAPPPDCAGLYFPGGYPELHAAALAANTAFRAALVRLAREGRPVYGECGGYIYLMRSLRLQGQDYPMSGLLPLSCTLSDRRAALGYRAALALPGWPAPPGPQAHAAPLWTRGHEYHYAAENGPLPPACRPLWRLYDSAGVLLREEGCRLGCAAGSWLHCYPEGSRRFWRAWLRALPRI